MTATWLVSSYCEGTPKICPGPPSTVLPAVLVIFGRVQWKCKQGDTESMRINRIAALILVLLAQLAISRLPAIACAPHSSVNCEELRHKYEVAVASAASMTVAESKPQPQKHSSPLKCASLAHPNAWVVVCADAQILTENPRQEIGSQPLWLLHRALLR